MTPVACSMIDDALATHPWLQAGGSPGAWHDVILQASGSPAADGFDLPESVEERLKLAGRLADWLTGEGVLPVFVVLHVRPEDLRVDCPERELLWALLPNRIWGRYDFALRFEGTDSQRLACVLFAYMLQDMEGLWAWACETEKAVFTRARFAYAFWAANDAAPHLGIPSTPADSNELLPLTRVR